MICVSCLVSRVPSSVFCVSCPVSRGFYPRLWSGHRAAVLFDGGVYLCIPPIPYFVGIVISVGVAMFVGFTIFRGLLTHSVGCDPRLCSVHAYGVLRSKPRSGDWITAVGGTYV